MKLVPIVLFLLFMLSLSASAQDCAVLLRLQSPYLQDQPLYLDEMLSQPVINDQICLSSNEMEYVDSVYYLELFDEDGRFVESLKIYPEYQQRGSVNINTVDLLSSYCIDCNTAKGYYYFVRSEPIQTIAREMDALIEKPPALTLSDILVKQDFRQRLLSYYKDPQPHYDLLPEPAQEHVETIVVSLTPDNAFALYDGAKLNSYFPGGIRLDNIDSLPIATFSIDASSDIVLSFYQELYPAYDTLTFGSFTVLVKETLPIDGYAPEYMQIPHLVISEDRMGEGKTLLQMTYQNSDNPPF